MLRSASRSSARLAITAIVGLAAAAPLAQRAHAQHGGTVISSAISVGRDEATLELELADGSRRVVSLRDGTVRLDGEVTGRYRSSGSLDRAWRQLLAELTPLEAGALTARLREWEPSRVAGDEAAAAARMREYFSNLAAAREGSPSIALQTARVESVQQRAAAVRLGDLEALERLRHQLERMNLERGVLEAVSSDPMHLGDVSVPAGQRVDGNVVAWRGSVDVRGVVTGSVVALFGSIRVHEGAEVRRDALAVAGELIAAPGTVRGTSRAISPDELDSEVEPARRAPPQARPLSPFDRLFRDVRNVVALFAALAMLGFGAVFFGRRYVETVADTVTHSFGRSLVVGVLGQLLLLPTLAMLVVGLVFTLVGILVLPFAVIAYVVAAFLAIVGGYLATAHAIGETFTRRRMAHGAFVSAPNAYGYLFTGLVGLLGLWALAALTGWMGPISIVFNVAAAIVTWVAATAGFGAVLLSRAGLRETFSGRHFGDQTDEYLWATPPATPTASRMKMDQ